MKSLGWGLARPLGWNSSVYAHLIPLLLKTVRHKMYDTKPVSGRIPGAGRLP